MLTVSPSAPDSPAPSFALIVMVSKLAPVCVPATELIAIAPPLELIVKSTPSSS